MINYSQVLEYYKGKRVFVTGHTGFKGTWLCEILAEAGAIVYGYSLDAPTDPSLYQLSGLESRIRSEIGDVRDYAHLYRYFEECKPQVVFHLAAQPLVIDSYKDPRYTYETNVMGTVNLLECVRLIGGVESFLNVTTDKVYYNDERGEGFTEDLPLDGFDPYSNSKSCSELVTHSYRSSFLKEAGLPVSTARAGNVIGGGDFADNRIIPDCVRAALSKQPVILRNPYSIRPFQHVLEPLFAYLAIAKLQTERPELADAYNVGPDEADCVTTQTLAEIFCDAWGDGQTFESRSVDGPHEAAFLRLDCGRLKETFGWEPTWNIKAAVEKTVEFSKAWQAGEDAESIMKAQIHEFLSDCK